MARYILILILIFLNFTDALSTEDEKGLENKIMQNYSINLFWDNKARDENQKYIFSGVDTPEQLRDKFLNNAVGWSKLHPKEGGGSVFIWYDSEMTTTAALKATQEEFSVYLEQPVTLKDSRTNSVISDPENERVFSEQTNVYFRSDLKRVILSLSETENGSTSCFVFANFNMKPLSRAELFDQGTLKKLRGSGLVMAHNTTGTNWSCQTNSFPNVINRTTPFENCFFMYSDLGTNHHQIMRDCLNYIMVKGSIQNVKSDRLLPVGMQDVFFLYGKLFSYYIGKTKGYSIGRFDNGKFIKFTEENYFEELTQLSCHVFDFEGQRNLKIQIPTKDVEVPTTQSGFIGLDMSNVIYI